MIAQIERIMEHETAGDPMTGLKWTRKTTKKIAKELKSVGIDISKNTVGRLLKNMKFSLRVNHKKICNGSSNDRDAQFKYISKLRRLCEKKGHAIISVDAKKRELIGRFKNPGKAWNQEPELTNDHDYPSLASGVAILYGVYDDQHKDGSVFVGTSHDTAEFAVDSIERWWRYDGWKRYADGGHLYILADGGGSNGSRPRVWKYHLQQKLCNRHGMTITVSHYPPGSSKWNPIEHRMFSAISNNWAGIPLKSYETVLKYIRTTKTSACRKLKAYLIAKQYATRQTISNEDVDDELFIQNHKKFPKWNYTLYPQ